MTNYFKGVGSKPYHLSVGAVLMNNEHEIACHHFIEVRGRNDIYTLMRETMEPNGTIDEALDRGLMEEFGAKARLVTYIGSSISSFKRGEKDIQKTTLYFLFELDEMKVEWRKPDDEEKDSKVAWRSAGFLTKQMAAQGAKYNMPDIDESEIVKRALNFMTTN
jgi:hypothetical protein